MGHTPVQAQDTPGFIVNHAGRGYGTEALRIVGEGVADFATIDRILQDQVGFKLGPFELMDLTALDVSHPVMESIYRQYYDEPRYRPSVITAQRLAGGVVGRKTGEGFYRYVDGKAQVPAEPPVPQVAELPPVWVSTRAARRAELYQLLKDLGAKIETGQSPSPHALTLVAPLGFDVTTVAVVERLDPARTVGIDMLIEDAATKRRVLATNPATRADMRDAAHALFARDGKAVSVIRDSGGFVTQRVVATIVNIAVRHLPAAHLHARRTWRPPSRWAWAIRSARWPWATAGARPTCWRCCSTCRRSTATRATAPAPGCAAAARSACRCCRRRAEHDRRTQEHQPGPHHGADPQQPRAPQRAGPGDVCGRRRSAERGRQQPRGAQRGDHRRGQHRSAPAATCSACRPTGSEPPEVQAQSIEGLHSWIEAIRTFPKPVIAAVEGAAAGAGFSLALACDFIVAARRRGLRHGLQQRRRCRPTAAAAGAWRAPCRASWPASC